MAKRVAKNAAEEVAAAEQIMKSEAVEVIKPVTIPLPSSAENISLHPTAVEVVEHKHRAETVPIHPSPVISLHVKNAGPSEISNAPVQVTNPPLLPLMQTVHNQAEEPC